MGRGTEHRGTKPALLHVTFGTGGPEGGALREPGASVPAGSSLHTGHPYFTHRGGLRGEPPAPAQTHDVGNVP